MLKKNNSITPTKISQPMCCLLFFHKNPVKVFLFFSFLFQLNWLKIKRQLKENPKFWVGGKLKYILITMTIIIIIMKKKYCKSL